MTALMLSQAVQRQVALGLGVGAAVAALLVTGVLLWRVVLPGERPREERGRTPTQSS